MSTMPVRVHRNRELVGDLHLSALWQCCGYDMRGVWFANYRVQIEEGNDPRDHAMFGDEHDDDDGSIPSLEEAPRGVHSHSGWAHADDPDEGDISTMRFQNIGPGRFQVSATIHRTISPVSLGPNGNGPNTLGGFTSFLTNILQGARQGQQQNQTGENQGSSGPAPNADGQPHVHRFTYTAGARLHPRDANHPEPRMEPVDELNK